MSWRLRSIAVLAASSSLWLPLDARAGFLDFLFAPSASPPVFSPPPLTIQRGRYNHPGRPVSRRIARPKPRPETSPEQAAAARAREIENVRRLSEIVATRGAMAAFLLDTTLRAGDIVVTQAGLQIFDGGRETDHRRNQFRPLSRTALRSGDFESLRRLNAFIAPPETAPRTTGALPPTVKPSDERADATGSNGRQSIRTVAPVSRVVDASCLAPSTCDVAR